MTPNYKTYKDCYILEDSDNFEEDLDYLLEKATLESIHLKKLSMKLYKKIKGYLPAKRIYKEIAKFIYSVETLTKNCSLIDKISIQKAFDLYFARDLIGVYNYSLFWHYIYGNYPIFCLNKELAEAFLNTAPPPDLLSLNPFAVEGLLLLPQGLIKTPDGDEVNYLIFRLFRQKESLKSSLLKVNINCMPFESFDGVLGCFKAGKANYTTQFSIQKTEKISPSEPIKQFNFSSESVELATNVELELDFINKVKSLLVQTFLYQQTYRQEEVYTPLNVQTTKHQAQSRIKPHSPIIIGKDYRIQRIREYSNGGTHASPRTHWRSGHWRNQPYGKRDNPQYKTIWLEPVLVGSSVNN
jgi:hypothetical protein